MEISSRIYRESPVKVKYKQTSRGREATGGRCLACLNRIWQEC